MSCRFSFQFGFHAPTQPLTSRRVPLRARNLQRGCQLIQFVSSQSHGSRLHSKINIRVRRSILGLVLCRATPEIRTKAELSLKRISTCLMQLPIYLSTTSTITLMRNRGLDSGPRMDQYFNMRQSFERVKPFSQHQTKDAFLVGAKRALFTACFHDSSIGWPGRCILVGQRAPPNLFPRAPQYPKLYNWIRSAPKLGEKIQRLSK